MSTQHREIVVRCPARAGGCGTITLCQATVTPEVTWCLRVYLTCWACGHTFSLSNLRGRYWADTRAMLKRWAKDLQDRSLAAAAAKPHPPLDSSLN